MVFIMWLLFYIQMNFEIDLGWLGIYPRTLKGLPGILTAPLIHRTLQHLIANTLPLLILGTLLYYVYPSKANLVFFRAYLFTNILVWLFGRSAWHIGASGIVYGLAFYIVTAGIVKKDFASLVTAALVVVLYSGLFQTLFLEFEGVSWEAHLLGAVVGTVTALEQFIAGKKRKT